MEARNVWVAWLALETLKAPLCGSFVLQQAPPPGRTKYKPAAGSRCSAAAPRARCSCLRGLHDPLLRPLLRSPRAPSSAIAPLSGTADDDTLGRDGVGKAGDKPPAAASDFDSSHETGGVGSATGEAAVGTDVATETRRLMSEPTIDIKLELQMRGVEHRDAFEKADLARRLAEARVSSCGNNRSPSPDDDDATTTTTTTKAAGRDFGGAAADGPRENAHRSNKASTMMGNEPQAAAATAVATEGRGAAPDGGNNSAYARDVAKGTRMGKAALARELNGMGIAHSRLSDLSVLARQYAARRQEAREDARRFPPSSARAGSSSPAEEDGEGGAEGRREGKKGSGRRRGGGEEEKGWGDARGQRAASGLPWRFGKEEEDEDEEDEAAGVGDAGFPLGGGGRDDVGEDGGSEMGWSTRANAGSAATADGGGGGGDKERSRKAVLHARADRMSSRELMKALDGLGARYRIPAPRAELQQAFVSAVLAAEEDERSQADATAAAAGTRGKNIVPVSPYDAPIEEGDGGLRGTQGFGTYHSALRWARQLNFDDVLDELRYRGVEHSPRADYSYLTRLLADEVLADEELMGGEGGPEAGADAYTAELEAAMSMSAQEMIRDLRAGGEIADVTLSKEALAERLAEMKLRLRGEPLPHSGSSAAYYYRESPPPSQGRARGGGGSAEARGPADPLGRRDDDEDVLLELEEAAKSVGGAALLVAREAAAFVSETAAGFFPRRRRQRRRAERFAVGSGESGAGSGGWRRRRRRARDGAVAAGASREAAGGRGAEGRDGVRPELGQPGRVRGPAEPGERPAEGRGGGGRLGGGRRARPRVRPHRRPEAGLGGVEDGAGEEKARYGRRRRRRQR
ncbi:unnamed protein product [Ectocarpus sp. 6 AP-2014]